MTMNARGKSRTATSMAHAERVGAAEFRGNLAKYLKRARSGTPIIIQERGRSAYVLLRFEQEASPTVFGCMRERTEYGQSAVVNADEPWPSGVMP